ncbi:MAG: Hsp20 family protein [Spartobacteria bacterium]|nr:Hsp20 family protein [Spartobacteria bacterium]
MRQWNWTALIHSITADRIVLFTVLAFQVGLAGWFYTYTREGDKQAASELNTPDGRLSIQHTQNVASQPVGQPAFSDSSSVIPSSMRSMRTPSHSAGMGRVITPPHPVALMDESFITPISFTDSRAVMAQMQDRMRRRMEAYQQKNALIYSDDDWSGLARSPTMDMRERGDVYEVTFSIPDAKNRDITTDLQDRLLTVNVNQSNEFDRGHAQQSFTSRILLPEDIDSDKAIETRFKDGNVILSISKSAAQ